MLPRTAPCFFRVLSLTGLVFWLMSSVAGAQAVTVTWDANRESNLAGYTLQYGLQPGNPSTSLDVGNVTSRRITGLQSATTYYFRVRAYNTTGQTSAPSIEVPFTTPGGGSTAPTISSINPTSGPVAGGTQIRVYGARFVSGARVLVQGRAAATVFVSATEVRATTAAGTAGSASVQVINPNNQSATLANAFTYTAPGPAPTITAVSPTSGPLAGGTQITIAGSNFVSGARVNVGDRSATTTFVNSTQLRASTPAGAAAGAVGVQVINPNGASATRAAAFTYVATVGAPVITSLSPTSGSLVGGTQITVGGRNFVNGSRVYVGMRAATTTFVSATQLRATTPAGAGTGRTSLGVMNPNGQYVLVNNAFTYIWSGYSTAETALAPSTADAVAADAALVEGDAIADAAAAQPLLEDGAAVRRYLPLDTSGATSRLALANAGSTPASATLTFVDAKGAASTLTIDVPARQRRTLDARSAPALRTPVSVVLDAPDDVALERLSLAADEGASTLTPAVAAAPRWDFAAGSTRQPFVLGFTIENPGGTEARVDARYLRSGDGEPLVAQYAIAPRGRIVIDVREQHPLLADADIAASFVSAAGAPLVVSRVQGLASTGGAMRAAEIDGGVSTAGTWRLTGETRGASLGLSLANPGDRAALVEARFTSDAGAVVTRRYDIGAQRLLTVDVASEDAALANTTVDIDLRSLDGSPIAAERSQWWGGRQGPADGIANAGPAAPAARWLLAEGEDGGAARALTTLLVTNVAEQEVTARITLLFEGAPPVSTTLSAPAGGVVSAPVGELARGRRFSVLVESADGSASLLAERRLFLRARDGRILGAASAAASRGRD